MVFNPRSQIISIRKYSRYSYPQNKPTTHSGGRWKGSPSFTTSSAIGDIGPAGPLEVFTHASFADDTVDRRSTQGFLMKLYGGPIAWKSGKQDTVTTSSTEAELLALTASGKEAMATLRLFTGIQLGSPIPSHRQAGVNTSQHHRSRGGRKPRSD